MRLMIHAYTKLVPPDHELWKQCSFAYFHRLKLCNVIFEVIVLWLCNLALKSYLACEQAYIWENTHEWQIQENKLSREASWQEARQFLPQTCFCGFTTHECIPKREPASRLNLTVSKNSDWYPQSLQAIEVGRSYTLFNLIAV